MSSKKTASQLLSEVEKVFEGQEHDVVLQTLAMLRIVHPGATAEKVPGPPKGALKPSSGTARTKVVDNSSKTKKSISWAQDSETSQTATRGEAKAGVVAQWTTLYAKEYDALKGISRLMPRPHRQSNSTSPSMGDSAVRKRLSKAKANLRKAVAFYLQHSQNESVFPGARSGMIVDIINSLQSYVIQLQDARMCKMALTEATAQLLLQGEVLRVVTEFIQRNGPDATASVVNASGEVTQTSRWNPYGFLVKSTEECAPPVPEEGTNEDPSTSDGLPELPWGDKAQPKDEE